MQFGAAPNCPSSSYYTFSHKKSFSYYFWYFFWSVCNFPYAHDLTLAFSNNHPPYLHPFCLGNVFPPSLDRDETFPPAPHCRSPSFVESIPNVNGGSKLLDSFGILEHHIQLTCVPQFFYNCHPSYLLKNVYQICKGFPGFLFFSFMDSGNNGLHNSFRMSGFSTFSIFSWRFAKLFHKSKFYTKRRQKNFITRNQINIGYGIFSHNKGIPNGSISLRILSSFKL